MAKLDGQVALVTGGAKGIGAAIAEQLAADGADVVVNVRHEPAQGDDVAARVRACGRRAAVVVGDVGDSAAVEALFAQIDSMFGRLDICINNAGISRPGDIFSVTLEDWSETMRINLTGPFLVSRAALMRMRDAGRGGRIVNIGSIVGHQGALRGHVHYAASKAGVHGFTKTLARTAAPFGVTVNAVSPGMVTSDMLWQTHGESGVQGLMAQVPLGSLPAPDEIASTVSYLCSAQARHVTGAILDINAGMLMR